MKCEELQTGYLRLCSGILWVHTNQAVGIFPRVAKYIISAQCFHFS